MNFVTPNSYGALREANACHEPAGKSTGGQFCSKGEHGPPVEGRTYYVRFGDPPASGRSTNFASGTIEAGISVYAAVGRRGKFQLEVPPDGEWAEDDLSDRIRQAQDDTLSAYVVEGDSIGTGHDGEPLLVTPRSKGKIPASLLTL